MYLRASILVSVTNKARTINIVVALVIATTLMGGAYILSSPGGFTNIATAESTKEILEAYAVKDTDNDLLPDWQEALYGTDPENPHSVNASVTDSEAVAQGLVQPKFSAEVPVTVSIDDIPGELASPDSLTDRFARELFEQYLENKGADPATPEQISAFTNDAVASLLREQGEVGSYTRNNVRIGSSGSASLRIYAEAAEAAFDSNEPSDGKSELAYLRKGMMDQDPAALAKLKSISATHGEIADALLSVSVPPDAVDGHLRIVNALKATGAGLAKASGVKSDPLLAMLGLAAYGHASDELIAGFATLAPVFRTAGVSIAPTEPGGDFWDSTTAAESRLLKP